MVFMKKSLPKFLWKWWDKKAKNSYPDIYKKLTE